MLLYRLLADLVLVLHVTVVLFVVSGLFLVLVGRWCGWQWIHNIYYRLIHLVAIGVVVAQACLGVVCPLTTLENYLRRIAGQAEYPSSFITYWLHSLLFFEAERWVFTLCYCLFGLAVLAGFVVAPPRLPKARRMRAWAANSQCPDAGSAE